MNAETSLIDLLVSQAQNGTLSSLTLEDWEQLALSADVQAYRANDTVVHQGEATGSIYIIANGEVRVERQAADGNVVELALLGKGAVVGEMSVLDNTNASANVVCSSDVELLHVDSKSLESIISGDAGFGLRFYRSLATALSRRLRATNEYVRAAA